MAIVKMKSVTIAGPIEQFDSIVEKYVYDKEIHLEDVISVITNKEKLYPFDDGSNYDPIIKQIEDISYMSGVTLDGGSLTADYSLSEMEQFIMQINDTISEDNANFSEFTSRIERNKELAAKLENMVNIDVDISKILSMKYITFAYGHIPKSSYKTLTTYLNDIDAIFVKTNEDSKFVWGFYFSPSILKVKVNEIFSSLYFEEVDIPKDCSGYPKQIINACIEQNKELELKIIEQKNVSGNKIKTFQKKLADMYLIANKRKKFSAIRKKSAHSKEFFYIVGWMPVKEVRKLEKQLDNKKEAVLFVSTDPDKSDEMKPPTKIHNNPIFRPFEMFVKMYGLPDYTELDPTPLLAITYILFFGIMFGDVGQSAVFAIAGFLLYKFKKSQLAGIVGMVGLSGVLFGFIYGSLFGNEEILPFLIRPMDSINQMLITTIAMGVFVIILGLGLNIINSFRAGDVGKALFSHNGLAGLVFYLTAISLVFTKLLKLFTIPNGVVPALLIVSIICMFLETPLSDLIAGKKNWFPKDGMFFVENLFEMFEVVLSYFTNTISFLRIGAFAIVHVGMMMVVGVLSKNGGVGGIVVQILGNVLVMGLEGLIVGIQVLRLEYYEMFSRYFSGQGREFVSINDDKKSK